MAFRGTDRLHFRDVKDALRGRALEAREELRELREGVIEDYDFYRGVVARADRRLEGMRQAVAMLYRGSLGTFVSERTQRFRDTVRSYAALVREPDAAEILLRQGAVFEIDNLDMALLYALKGYMLMQRQRGRYAIPKEIIGASEPGEGGIRRITERLERLARMGLVEEASTTSAFRISGAGLKLVRDDY
jgi:hypothetical protein